MPPLSDKQLRERYRRRSNVDAAARRAAFFARVDRQPDGCWLYRGWTNNKGYAGINWMGVKTYAHRVSYAIHHPLSGPIDRLVVMHSCDVRTCVNPAHLRLGTVGDNQADMAAKGRSHGGYKLSDDDVRAIRRDPRPAAEVAADYDTTRGYVYDIRNRHARARVV